MIAELTSMKLMYDHFFNERLISSGDTGYGLFFFRMGLLGKRERREIDTVLEISVYKCVCDYMIVL